MADQNKEEKVICTTSFFDVIEKDGWYGVKPHRLNVIVFPYITGNNGLPEELVLVKEKNPLRKNGENIALVTGDAEGEDPDILAAAQRELKEETGYDVSDPNRWTYLGVVTGSKVLEQEQPAFSVDVTGITPSDPKGDGSLKEKQMKVVTLPIIEALDLPDAYIPALFVRVFKYVFGIDFKSKTSK